MLQMVDLNRRASSRVGDVDWKTMEELERQADARIESLRRARAELATTRRDQLGCWLDARVRSTEVETLDQPDHPEARKLEQIKLLHLQNRLLRSYVRYVRVLEPVVAEARARRGHRRVRVLELASGAGEMTMALSAEMERRGWDVDVTGSDIVPAYVDDANARAHARGSRATFRLIDAFELASAVQSEAFDVVLVAQSAHHFSAGQLARLIAAAQAMGGTHVVIIDGHRSLRLLVGLPVLAALSLDRDFTHDAWISARRLFSEPELAAIARLAAPSARVSTQCVWPLTSVLTVAF
ncbi:MAG: methyltransferase domain-containing protein [Polyangiaceae bacterium]